MDTLIQLNNKAQGRDKIARVLQYSCRTLWDSIRPNENNTQIIDKLKTLEYLLSSFRKLLRFGKCIDVFYSSLSSIHYPDVTIKVTLTMSKISQALFLLADHIVWVARTGIVKGIDTNKWLNISNKYWLLSIIMNLVRDFYEISNILDSGCKKNISQNISNIKSKKDLSTASLEAYKFMYRHRAIVIDTVKNGCDFFIPFTALGYTKLNPKVIGCLGVISSIAGLLAIIEPKLKLTPA